MSQVIEMEKKNGVFQSKAANLFGKAIGTAGVAAGALIAAAPSWALDATQNQSISDGYTSTSTTVTTIIAGLLSVGLIITGFSIVWSLIRK